MLGVARQIDLAAQGLLNSAKLYDVEGYTVVVQMDSDLLCGKIEADQTRAAIEEAFRRVFQQPLTIRCRVQTGNGEQQSRETEDLLAQDNVAAFAVNELGGVISHIEETDEENN